MRLDVSWIVSLIVFIPSIVRRTALTAYVTLYKALGGGWTTAEEAEAEVETTEAGGGGPAETEAPAEVEEPPDAEDPADVVRTTSR